MAFRRREFRGMSSDTNLAGLRRLLCGFSAPEIPLAS